MHQVAQCELQTLIMDVCMHNLSINPILDGLLAFLTLRARKG